RLVAKHQQVAVVERRLDRGEVGIAHGIREVEPADLRPDDVRQGRDAEHGDHDAPPTPRVNRPPACPPCVLRQAQDEGKSLWHKEKDLILSLSKDAHCRSHLDAAAVTSPRSGTLPTASAARPPRPPACRPPRRRPST